MVRADMTFCRSATVNTDIPVTFGSAAEFRMGLLIWVGIGIGNGTMASDFGNTATLTGVESFVGPTKITDFSLTSACGATYTAAGVQIPEPTGAICTIATIVTLGHRRGSRAAAAA